MRVAHQTKSRTAAAPEPPVERVVERRAYVRARLKLPLSVSRIAGQATEAPALHIHDISSSGAYFIYPDWVEPGTPLTLEVSLIEERRRHRAVRMCVDAHVVRAKDAAGKPGWHGLAVAFDEIRFVRNGHALEPPVKSRRHQDFSGAAASASQ